MATATRWVRFGLVLVIFLVWGQTAAASALFIEGFEGDLSLWTGQGVGAHHGIIVIDPLDASNSNHVLTFTDTNLGGDIFTVDEFGSSGAGFILSFDYLGRPELGGVEGNLGGFVGYSLEFPGEHVWLAGTNNSSGAQDILPDTGQWEHVEIGFEATGEPIHLMLQDCWCGGATGPGDAFFDNFRLTQIPEPNTALLLTLGLIGMGVRRRRLN
jgi:hypothetical protein